MTAKAHCVPMCSSDAHHAKPYKSSVICSRNTSHPLFLQREYSMEIPRNVPPALQEVTIESHTMGDSLKRYLEMKVHPLVGFYDWDKLIVTARHDRNSELGAVTSSKEKADKPFNWMRPTG